MELSHLVGAMLSKEVALFIFWWNSKPGNLALHVAHSVSKSEEDHLAAEVEFDLCTGIVCQQKIRGDLSVRPLRECQRSTGSNEMSPEADAGRCIALRHCASWWKAQDEDDSGYD